MRLKKVSASHLDRLMKCAGFPDFVDLPEDDDRTKREEGICASEYLELKLKGIQVGTHAKSGLPFTEEIKGYIDPIVEGVHASLSSDSQLAVEQWADWDTRAGVKIKCKLDAAFAADDNLYIDDLKYGWSLVEAYENWQLLSYAIGEVMRRGRAFNEIVMRIHQPRPHHEDGSTREWRIPYTKLLEYKETIEKRMELLQGGENTLCTGSHCKYCPAAGEACPALNKAFYRGVEIAHEFTQDKMNEQEISHQLDLITRVEELIKIKKQSVELLAQIRIKEGKIVPNYSIENRIGDRQWNQEVTPEFLKMMTGKNVIVEKMMSPAQAEKLGVDKKLVSTLVNRPQLGPKLKRLDTGKLGNKIFGNEKPT